MKYVKLYYKTYLKNLNRALLCCKVRKEVPRVLKKSGETLAQPRPQGLLLVQNGGQRNPWPRLPKWLQKFVRISLRKHDEMSSFCLINSFRLQKTNRATRRWKQPSKKPFHHVSRDKILHDSWSISAALARGFSNRHLERGEGPGDEVDTRLRLVFLEGII